MTDNVKTNMIVEQMKHPINPNQFEFIQNLFEIDFKFNSYSMFVVSVADPDQPQILAHYSRELKRFDWYICDNSIFCTKMEEFITNNIDYIFEKYDTIT